jgi:hypothetical protein
MPETGVALLITQRSQIQILPPLSDLFSRQIRTRIRSLARSVHPVTLGASGPLSLS